jgi:hypothetical protein
MTVSYDGAVARVRFDNKRLEICALESGLAIDSATVDRILEESDERLAKGETFQALWDLRFCPVPDARTVVRCVRWALINRTKLLKLNSALAVVIPTRPAITALCTHVLAFFGPTCPVLVSHSRADAIEFLNDQVLTNPIASESRYTKST